MKKQMLLPVLLTFALPWWITALAQVQQSWAARYNGTGNYSDYASGIAVDGLRNVYVTGLSYDNTGRISDYATAKYDDNGNQVWAVRHHSPDGLSDIALAIALDRMGNSYVTGYSYSNISYCETVKYDPNGNELWVARFTDAIANAITVGTDGSLYIVGYSDPVHFTEPAYITVKYDPDGNQLWAARYEADAAIADALAVDHQGNVYVTGRANGGYGTVKYDSSGNQLWIARYKGPGDGEDVARAIRLDGVGNAYVTGYSQGLYSQDFATVKYDANGKEIWVARYVNGDATALAVDNSGDTYVTGYAAGDYTTVKYDAQGNRLWVSKYNGPGNGYDRATAVALDEGDNVYVSGSSVGASTNWDFATVKYDTNGNQLWVARYNSIGNSPFDGAAALVLDSTGNIYVTGTSAGSTSADDYVTAKYSQTELAGLPLITSQPQPQSQVVAAGTNLTFSVTAAGLQPLSYQWRLNGTKVPGATNSVFVVTNVQISGSYSVEVANSVGTTISPEASLDIATTLSQPTLLADGTFQLNLVGEAHRTFTLEVSADLQGWTILDTLFDNPGTYPFNDLRSTNLSQRFYRAVKPP